MSEAQKYLQNFDPNMDSDVPYDFLEGIFNETAEMQNNDDEISAFLDELMPCLDDQLSTSQNTLEHVPTVLEKYESYIITMVDTYKRVEASLSEHDLCCASTIECCKDFMARCVEFAENVRVFLEETFYPRFNLWQHQQLYPNIEPIESETLDQFEVWFNELYILLSSIRSQVKNTYAKHNSIWTDRGEYSLIQDKLLNNLVRKSCIFVEHPNQVLMKNSKFPVIIKCLIALSEIRKVEAFIILESNALTIQSRIEESAEELSALKPTEKVIKLKQPLITVVNEKITSLKYEIKVTAVVRAKTSDYVTEQVQRIIFLIGYNMPGMDKPDTIFLLSVPTAVIVHAKQEFQAWGKIMWENTIAKHNLSITNGNQISFPFLLERLNQKFHSIVGENLTETNKRAISCFFTNTIPQSELVVSYDSFCKVKAVKHTFWDWFYHAMKLIKDVKNLKEMVGRGHIEGFISYGETITKLMSCTNGTFLVRFSESVLGALTISYNDNGVITHVSDFNKDKLAAIPLIDTIRDSIKLSMLYPNICKSVFETYQSKEKVAVQRSGGNNRGYKKFFDLFHK